MNQSYPEYWPQYFTATIYEWRHLLADNSRKNIIIESLRFLVSNKRISLNAFVIMDNHFHAIWQPLFGFAHSDIQASFMRHTAKQLMQSITEKQDLSASFLVNKPSSTRSTAIFKAA